MQKFDVNGIEVAVEVTGSGPPLLLVHGFPLDHSMWRHQIEHFADRQTVIAPDLRGFGGSGVTAGVVTMRQYADDLAALLDAMGISQPVTLCGLSMGGYVAFQFVQHHRGRLGRLILCDTRAAADTEEGRATRMKMADLVERSGTAFLAESMPAKLFAGRALGSEVDHQQREVIRRANPRGVVAALHGMAQRPDVTSVLRTIDVPTLVIVGSEDAITPPAEMKQMAEAIPDAAFVEIAGAGHMSPLEMPQEFNVAVSELLC